MEKREACGTCIYVTKMPVTPSTIGIFRPKIIMPEVILKEYDQKDLQTISISVNSEKESKEVSETIGKITRKINKCVVKDYSEQIRQQNRYLFQKMFFYYGIAAVLLGISILHMINSMQYLIAAGAEYWNLC